MKHVTSFVTAVAMTLVFGIGLMTVLSPMALAQDDGQPAKPPATKKGTAKPEPQGPPVVLDVTKPHDQYLTLDLVEVVGCLAVGPNNTFVLTDATDPVKSAQASTTQAALDADKTKTLGTQRYVIIGATEWNPSSHKGHKIAAKGLLIKDAKETRLNVTSFQMVDSTCAKEKH